MTLPDPFLISLFMRKIFLSFLTVHQLEITVLHCKNKIPKFRNKYSQKRNVGVSVPISTFMRLSVIYIFPQSVCLLCWRKYVDRSWDYTVYVNCSQTHECGNWGWGRAIPRQGIHKWDFRCSVYICLLPSLRWFVWPSQSGFATFDNILCIKNLSFIPRKLQSLSHPSPTWKTSSCSSGTSWRTAALCRLCTGYEILFSCEKTTFRQKTFQRKVLICVPVIIRKFRDNFFNFRYEYLLKTVSGESRDFYDLKIYIFTTLYCRFSSKKGECPRKLKFFAKKCI